MSVTAPAGFRAAGVVAGFKSSGDRDVALVVNDGPIASAAAVFTSNRCKANPVLWSQEAIKTGSAKAVLINSGGANCYTGSQGFQTTHASAEKVAELLGCGAIDVQVMSTGLIGKVLETDRILSAAGAARDALSADGGESASLAIMTTDSVPKRATRTVTTDQGSLTIGGMAKGAGMLAPALATMLVVITTDADLTSAQLDEALRAATASSFDRLDSDGCQSTNDTVLLMASGAADFSPAMDVFTEQLTDLCRDLALQLLSDAEGSEHDVSIEVVGAASESDALEVARSVARSNLFKAAIFGKDPNWGRVLASVGTTQAVFDPADLDVALNGVWVCRNSGTGESVDQVDLDARAVTVTIDLKSGKEAATIWTNDLTHAYVHENSAYST